MEQKNEELANEICQHMNPLLRQFSDYAMRALMIAAISPNGDTSWFQLVINGIQGYDPVSFFTDGKPVLGKILPSFCAYMLIALLLGNWVFNVIYEEFFFQPTPG